MIDIKVVGDDILVDGHKIAELKPAKALSYSDIEDFKQHINKYKPLIKAPKVW